MLKKILYPIAALTASFVLAGIFDRPFLYTISFFFWSYSVLFAVLAGLAWWRLPEETKCHYKKRHLRFCGIVLAVMLLMILGTEAINNHYLTNVAYLSRIIGRIVLVALIGILGWKALRQTAKKGTFACALAILVLALMAPGLSKLLSGNRKTTEKQQTDLRSLGYVGWVDATETLEKSGVVKNEPTLACPGVNVYKPRTLSKAYVIDMNGNVLNKWTLEDSDEHIWPYIELLPNGNIWSLANDTKLTQLDWQSNFIKEYDLRPHHSFWITENSDMWTILWDEEVAFVRGLPIPILNDYLILLSPEGHVKRRISICKSFGEFVPFCKSVDLFRKTTRLSIFKDLTGRVLAGENLFESVCPFDIFHTNSVQEIDRDIPGLCKKGDLLVSVRQLSMIGIIDCQTERLIWSWGPEHLERQHHPTLLDNGNILIFDNGAYRGFSQIIELNPLTRKIEWKYQADPPEAFYTHARGSVQRLPNGNTLITESNSGRVFEVTRDGQIVWEFFAPDIQHNKKKRAAIYRMTRITDPENYEHLKDLIHKTGD